MRELIDGENIMIHPLKVDNIKGSSINLTASEYAWKISDGKSAKLGKNILIPPQETVCIYTEESIWVSRRIGGTYHSKVSQVSKGLGHISTTLDPQWLGLSLIAINNPTSHPIEIPVGSTFVSLMLSYLETPSTKGKNENAPSRPDISSKFELTTEVEEYLRKESNRSYEGLKKAMVNSEGYKELIKEKEEFAQEKKEFRNTFWFPLITALIAAIVGGVISGLIVWQIQSIQKPESTDKNTSSSNIVEDWSKITAYSNKEN
jgi:deoxycytidine triphosphate deaminase